MSLNAQVLDVLLQPEDRLTESNDHTKEGVLKLSVINKAREFVKSDTCTQNNLSLVGKKFLESVEYSAEETRTILEATEGQAVNQLWHSIRKGMLTASNFGQASHYIDIQREPSTSFMNVIMGETKIDEQYLPAPLKWGRRKEPIARLMYLKLLRRNHFSMKVQEKGFLLCKENPFLGCSVDGIVSCKCRPPHAAKLIEIKCPYASRDMLPKDVAVEKKLSYNRQSCNWEVTPDCPYYAQIQGQLGLFGLTECDLVIYTKKGIHISTASFDTTYFSKMLEKLSLFHEKYVLPLILQTVLSE